MNSLILFVALGGGASIEYDHGYWTSGRSEGKEVARKWVPLVEKFQAVGTYTTHDKQAAFILEYRNGYEIMTLDGFRKHALAVGLKKTKRKLPVFDDSDLSIDFTYDPQKRDRP